MTPRSVAVTTMAILISALALISIASCSTGRAPTETQARSALSESVSMAKSGDVERLCHVHGSHAYLCLNDLARLGGRSSAPLAAPHIASSKSVDGSRGWLLSVCGRDGFGRPYRTDFVVYRRAGQLDVPYPVYWSGRIIGDKIGTTSATAAASDRSPALC